MSGIGDYRHSIDLQAPTKVSDGAGGWTTTYSTIASSISAKITPVSAKEQIKSQQTTMVATHIMSIRYRNVLKPNWRVSYAGKYYNIVSIIDRDMQHRWLDLLVKELV